MHRVSTIVLAPYLQLQMHLNKKPCLMKRLFTFLLVILFSASVFGQSTEYSVQLGSGFFSFRKNLTSSIYSSSQFGSHGSYWYLNKPYGQNSAFSDVVDFQIQRITKYHFIYGLQVVYESLSSRTKKKNITLYEYNPWSMAAYPVGSDVAADGQATLTYKYLTLHPFLGTRMKIINGINTDIALGIDLAFCVNSSEKMKVITDNWDYSVTSEINRPKLDSRLRIDLNNYYKHFGLTIGYSYGLKNYEAEMNYGDKIYSQMFRLGLAYRF
jgi:hypothetical protein